MHGHLLLSKRFLLHQPIFYGKDHQPTTLHRLVKHYAKRVEGYGISGYVPTETVLKALASGARLEILECIQKGMSNPGEIAGKLSRHRSTIEKHLRVLLTAKIVKKVPSLTGENHLTIRYNLQGNVRELLGTVQKLCQEISKTE